MNRNVEEQQDAISELEQENEQIEQNMSLRDRIKIIFKKYGFTAVAVLSSIGVVIGVIVSSLKNGFTSFARGLGNGLKTLWWKSFRNIIRDVGSSCFFFI